MGNATKLAAPTDAPEPAPADDFKAGMRRLAAGVSLIATGTNSAPYGLVVTSVSSVSVEPPTLLVCVNRTASAHDAISETGYFSVNVLGQAGGDIAGAFASSARRAERFVKGQWQSLVTGAPVLTDALVAFDCTVASSFVYASHTIFLGLVRGVYLSPQETAPLVYYRRGFHCLTIGEI